MARNSRGSPGAGLRRRDLLLLLILALLGSVCIAVTAQMAVTPARMFEVPQSVLSEIDPDELLGTPVVSLQPIRPDVLTPPGVPVTVLSVTLVSTSFPAPAPHESPIGKPPPNLFIEAEWPATMATNRLDSIRLSLVRATGDEFVPVLGVAPGHMVVSATPLPVGGTPDALIETAFGPGYGASAVARLEGAAFEISPRQPDDQSLDPSRVTWYWYILTREPGRHIIDVCVSARWTSVDGAGEVMERDMWCSPLEIWVE